MVPVTLSLSVFLALIVSDMPSAEVVASALLHLNNNPQLFRKWRKHPGYTFKANGKMFRWPL
jgi:hypothetical protein